jgi:hypothetical protein
MSLDQVIHHEIAESAVPVDVQVEPQMPTALTGPGLPACGTGSATPISTWRGPLDGGFH